MNKAVFMTGIQKFEVKEIEMPEIKPDEILVQMEYVPYGRLFSEA